MNSQILAKIKSSWKKKWFTVNSSFYTTNAEGFVNVVGNEKMMVTSIISFSHSIFCPNTHIAMKLDKSQIWKFGNRLVN